MKRELSIAAKILYGIFLITFGVFYSLALVLVSDSVADLFSDFGVTSLPLFTGLLINFKFVIVTAVLLASVVSGGASLLFSMRKWSKLIIATVVSASLVCILGLIALMIAGLYLPIYQLAVY
jgi:hypothetical protein